MIDINKLDDLPKRERFRANIDTYDLYDKRYQEFKALKGLLRKGIGKSWGKVYSDILQYIKTNFSADLHKDMIDRIGYHVELNPMEVGPDEYVDAHGHPFSLEENHWLSLLVHPKSGILMRPKEAWTKIRFTPIKDGRRYHEVTKDTIRYVNDRYFRKIRGIWYEGEMKRVPKDKINHSGWVPRDKDPLYQENLYDAVMKTRIYSDFVRDLQYVHGYMTADGSFISYHDYEAKMKHYYSSQPLPQIRLITTFPMYCANLWQVDNFTKKTFGLE